MIILVTSALGKFSFAFFKLFIGSLKIKLSFLKRFGIKELYARNLSSFPSKNALKKEQKIMESLVSYTTCMTLKMLVNMFYHCRGKDLF